LKKRIFKNFSILAIITAILTAVLISVIFYNFYITSEWESLRNTGYILANTMTNEKYRDFNYLNKIKDQNPNLRLTVVDSKGVVLFDSDTDEGKMENHLERPEIKSAIENGNGESTRYSSTLGKDTHYFSILLSNDLVLRIARDSENMFSALSNILPWILVILILVISLSFLMSSLLTKKILKPIQGVTENIDKLIKGVELKEVEIYDELLPFTKAVNRQSLEIKEYIKELKEKADTIQVITQNMSEGFMIIEKNKKIVLVNNSAIRLLETRDDRDYYGENFIVLSRDMEINRVLEKVLENGENKDIFIHLADRYLNIYINPVMNDGVVIGAMMLIVDNTDKYKAEKMRKEFSANVSHELKTPLTSINGYAEIIESGLTSREDTIKFAGTIRKEGNRLLELIDSIIKLSKLDEDFEEKEFELVDLYELANSTVEKFSIVAEEKNISLNVEGSHNQIQANKSMMEELLYNLIDNGIKYNKTGGSVNVKIEYTLSSTILTVTDTGIGISKADQERVFERFYMADKSRGKQSTGLGLSIVKHIVEYHNGKITLKSKKDKGTEITIELNICPRH